LSGNGTIVAVSSPPGGGGRGVVRLSGDSSRALASSVVDPFLEKRGVRRVQLLLPGSLSLPAVLYFMPGPRSYTGEDVVEIHLPGSPPVLRLLVDTLIERGAEPAGPGEFTQRAYLNRRVDLIQAEAVQTLIQAQNIEEVRAARQQLSGGLSDPLSRVEEALVNLCADVEASIDFVDQDIDLISDNEISLRLSEIQEALSKLLTQSRLESTAQPVVALYGPPNAGKSTLFNLLTREEAMVSDLPGTTRDFLSGKIDSIQILDLAGDQDASGVDGEAVLRSRRMRDEADLVLFVVDGSHPEGAARLNSGGRPAILVVNKLDQSDPEQIEDLFQRSGFIDRIAVSAKTGDRIEDLCTLLRERIFSDVRDPMARFHVTIRQHAYLKQGLVALQEANQILREGRPIELVALDLRAALECLGSISGRHVSEEILDRIFSRFCLGK
jgi:tRNA modification GTPase